MEKTEDRRELDGRDDCDNQEEEGGKRKGVLGGEYA